MPVIVQIPACIPAATLCDADEPVCQLGATLSAALAGARKRISKNVWLFRFDPEIVAVNDEPIFVLLESKLRLVTSKGGVTAIVPLDRIFPLSPRRTTPPIKGSPISVPVQIA